MSYKVIHLDEVVTPDNISVIAARLQAGDRIQILCEDGFVEAQKLPDGSFDILRQVPTHSQTQ